MCEESFFMHCPQCGQQAFSDERFCRHCGFSLDQVKSLLAPAQHEESTDLSSSWLDVRVGADLRSRHGLNQAAALVLLPLAAILLLIIQGVFSFALVPFWLLAKAFLFLVILPILRFVYAVYEAKQELNLKDKGKVSAGTHKLELSPKQSVPLVHLSGQQLEAAEVVQPPSVTEHTTKRLNDTKD
jgi:hypothetical protein